MAARTLIWLQLLPTPPPTQQANALTPSSSSTSPQVPAHGLPSRALSVSAPLRPNLLTPPTTPAVQSQFAALQAPSLSPLPASTTQPSARSLGQLRRWANYRAQRVSASSSLPPEGNMPRHGPDQNGMHVLCHIHLSLLKN